MQAAKRPARPAQAARRGAKGEAPSEHTQLVTKLSEALGQAPHDVVLRALRELAARNGLALAPPPAPAAAPPSTRPPHSGPLPQRLFLLLDGRGLDGRGLPVEVLQFPTTVGSGKFCQVWINSPRIETRHLQVTQEGDEYIATDLSTEHGTFLGEERVHRRTLQHGDELRLAGYLRVRAELR